MTDLHSSSSPARYIHGCFSFLTIKSAPHKKEPKKKISSLRKEKFWAIAVRLTIETNNDQKKSILWLEERSITHLTSDYTKDSILSILDSITATALISFLNPPTALYVPLHTALLQACLASSTCKRFIPSEWCGNIDNFPLLPSFYGTSREPFRKLLAKETAPVEEEWGKKRVDWTLVNNGWLMDYFLTKGKTWMPAIPDEFPVDPNGWGVCVRGTGDEPQSFTSARDIGKAVVELLAWEGEWVRFFFLFPSLSTRRKPPSNLPPRQCGLVANLRITLTNA